jgi:cardiolipin synthase
MAAGERLAQFRQAVLGVRRASRVRFSVDNRVRIFGSGNAFFSALIERIDAAEREVVLETYIICDDPSGSQVCDALIRAARRGLRVRVITDGIGTARLDLFRAWQEAGIEHRVYNPGFFSARFGFSRTHRKLAAVDRRYGFCGGHNIVDDMFDVGRPLPFPRWDYSAELEGPAVADLVEAFDLQWRRVVLKQGVPGTAVPDEARTHADDATPQSARARRRAPGLLHHRVEKPQIAFVARDNVNNRRAIERAYLLAIRQARHEILVANPYFVPGHRVRRALVRAARRGVQVSLVIGRNEFITLDYAVPFLYRSLLNAGVRVAEYHKTILHGKVAVVDGIWGTVGSSNLDALSLVLNHEANIVLVRHPEIAELRRAITDAFAESRPIDRKHYESRPIWERFANWLAYTGYRFVMKLLTDGDYD